MLPLVIKNLIIINALVFLYTFLDKSGIALLGLHPFDSPLFKPYQLVTFMFTHGNFFHFFFNMFALWMFGNQVESIWGPKKFLIFYLVCGLASALGQMGFSYLLQDNSYSILVGASGAIYGILVGYAFLFPNQQLMLLFPPIPIRAKWLITIILAIDVVQGFTGGGDIAHFAHISGAIMGILILLFWRSRGELYK